MSAFLLGKDEVSDWIRKVAREQRMYFPQKAGRHGFRFLPVNAASEIQFERYLPTLAPPGKKLAPSREVLFHYRQQDGAPPELTPVLEDAPQVLAGVRPCDLKAIHLMDLVNQECHGDPHYLTRRTHTLLIGCDCPHPCDEGCFCEATGSLNWRDNADLFLTPIEDDGMLLEARSPQGEALIQDAGFTPCPNPGEYRARFDSRRPRPFGRQFHAGLPRIAALIPGAWNSPVWKKHVQQCFSCGTCNLVCPTCYCFDVRDDFDLSDRQAGQRTRTSDACMLPAFAEVAGGHNFRSQAAGRQRHRVKRKFEYLPVRFAEASFCIGCGRCSRQCTAGIDIFNIVNDLIDHAEVPA
ncbi:MAG: 4Fe-4S dicluster domain-containing protein [Alphaproteobacteria bacterium]